MKEDVNSTTNYELYGSMHLLSHFPLIFNKSTIFIVRFHEFCQLYPCFFFFSEQMYLLTLKTISGLLEK
jgi:hypothetical protein